MSSFASIKTLSATHGASLRVHTGNCRRLRKDGHVDQPWISSTAQPAVTVAGLRFDRTAALLDGRVRCENVTFVNVPGGPTAADGLMSGAFDAADIPLVQYVAWKFNAREVTAIPVFSDRLFQRPYVYTRPDTGITNLGDLRGRRVMSAPSYFGTPAFWHRAILQEDYGIEPSAIEWFSATPLRADTSYPPGVRVTYCPASYLGLERLLDGTVDALMTARTAMVLPGDAGRVVRVAADAHERDREGVARNGFFPILHVIVLRNASLMRRPELAVELCGAFDRSKEYAYRILQDERMTSLPFMRRYLDETVAVWGDDPWPYGVEANRAVLARFLGYAHEQGLVGRTLSVDELFDNPSAGYTFQARMTPGCITATADGGWAAIPTWPDTFI
jgi:4,5-dihydroxyphthalate decarboxylase